MRVFAGIVFFFLSLSYSSECQEYNMFQIPDSLAKGTNVVIRYDSVAWNISGPGKAVMERHLVFTILNRHGDAFSDVNVSYDRNSKVNSFSGEILDKFGKRVRKIKKNEISDNSYISNYSLFQDDRYLSFDALNQDYPYTIVADYEVQYNGLVSIGRWFPVIGFNVSVEKSIYTISTNNSVDVRFKPVNINADYEKTVNDGLTIHQWKIEQLKSYDSQPYSPPAGYTLPAVWTIPDKFEFEGSRGEFESWNTFGKWEWGLLEGRQELPEQTVNKINNLVADASSELEKAKILYNYLQENARYVSIQLGIGGWQPFAASVVDEVGYGDCKALTNYMMSLLKVAGIESFYSLIGNDRSKILFPDFPAMGQANHIILCVPFQTDTVWLECTNQQYPFGYIGLGNSNRLACLITPEGGKLVKTPRYDENSNLQVRKAEITIDNKGNAQAEINTKFTGLQYGIRNFILDENREDQKKWLLSNLDLESPVLNSFQFDEERDEQPQIRESVSVALIEYANLSGKRMFLKPNLMNRFNRPPEKTENRIFPVERTFAYTDIDSVFYNLPEGYKAEALFDSIHFSSEFGEYTANIEYDEGKLLYIRKIIMKDGVWPAAKYNQFRDFFTEVWRNDQSNVVFVRE